MYKVILDYAPSQADNAVVKEGLIKSYEAQFGERDKEFSIFLKNNSGKVFGGVQAIFDSEAIYIEALWIEENLRKQGYGKKLLAAAEREAIENGCRFSLYPRKFKSWP
jgi:GNAT superfamily N-acetyltransferase